jgi:hypothetical protein
LYFLFSHRIEVATGLKRSCKRPVHYRPSVLAIGSHPRVHIRDGFKMTAHRALMLWSLAETLPSSYPHVILARRTTMALRLIAEHFRSLPDRPPRQVERGSPLLKKASR